MAVRRVLALGLAAYACVVTTGAPGSTSASASAVPGMAEQLPPGCRGTALVSARSGAVDRSFPDLAVSSAVADGRGGWFVTAGGLLRLGPRGRIERRWRSREFRGALQHLVRIGSRLYATDGRRVFAFDAASGRRLWSSGIAGGVWWNGVRPTIYALRADSVAVYVGGSFTRFAGVARAAVAALDAGTGELRDWRLRLPAKPGAEPATVVALGLGSGHLYAASASFTDGPARVGGRARDPTAARVRLLEGGFVDAILVSHGIVFVGGHDGRPAFSASTGHAVARLRGVFGSVFAARGNLVYVGGNLRDGSPGRNNLAAVNLATGGLTGWSPSIARFVSVGTIAPSRGAVLVAGSFCRSIG